MSQPELLRAMVYVNLIAGGMGFLIYGLWAGKWLRRGRWWLFFWNAAASVVIAGFAFGYATLALDPGNTREVHNLFRFLVPLVIGVPVLTRIAEYRLDQRREGYAKSAIRGLMGGRTHDD